MRGGRGVRYLMTGGGCGRKGVWRVSSVLGGSGGMVDGKAKVRRQVVGSIMRRVLKDFTIFIARLRTKYMHSFVRLRLRKLLGD